MTVHSVHFRRSRRGTGEEEQEVRVPRFARAQAERPSQPFRRLLAHRAAAQAERASGDEEEAQAR